MRISNVLIQVKSMKKVIIAVLAAILLLPSLSAQATYRSEKRQDARDIRQDARTTGREEKRDCVVSNDKSNAQCRQDKRENRRVGRYDARNEKW